MRGYLVHVAEQAEAAYRKGLSFVEAADTIDLGEYATWLDAERVVVNVYQRYRELDPDTPQLAAMGLLAMQAEWLAKHSVIAPRLSISLSWMSADVSRCTPNALAR